MAPVPYRRFMICDEDSPARRRLGGWLCAGGHAVLQAGCHRSSIAALEGFDPDVVLIGGRHPARAGLLARGIRRLATGDMYVLAALDAEGRDRPCGEDFDLLLPPLQSCRQLMQALRGLDEHWRVAMPPLPYSRAQDAAGIASPAGGQVLPGTIVPCATRPSISPAA